MIIKWIKTEDAIPSANMAVELLGYGSAVSSHVDGRYAIMRYDGENWWNMDGTSLSAAPVYWANINAPNQVNVHNDRTSMQSTTLDEWIEDWEAEVKREAATFMSQGLTPSEAGDRARAVVSYSRRQKT